MPNQLLAPALSEGQVAARLGVTRRTVSDWIKSGELRAINVNRRPGAKKPRWRIIPEALAAFEAARSNAAAATTTRQRKRSADVIQFY